MSSSTLDKLKYYETLHDVQERALWASLSVLGRPNGLLFIGCGDGYAIRTAASTAIRPSIGVEDDHSVCQSSYYSKHILCKQFDELFEITGIFDLVLCLRATTETTNLEVLGDNLVRHTRQWLVCEAPIPANVSRGLRYQEDLSDRLRCATKLELGVYRSWRD